MPKDDFEMLSPGELSGTSSSKHDQDFEDLRQLLAAQQSHADQDPVAPQRRKAHDPSSPASTRRPVNLLAKAVELLSHQEHSEASLRKKLARYTEDPAAIDAVMARLQKENWQSEERFAQSFLHSREQRWGNAKILQALAEHKLDDEIVQNVKESLRDSEYERALAVWQKKFAGKPCPDLKAKARQIRFLASRGFSADVVYKIVNDHVSI